MYKLNFFVWILVTFLLGTAHGHAHVTTRIIGGRETRITKFPYTLQLWYETMHICGATLINPTTAITAAHCLMLYGQYFVRAGASQVDQAGTIAFIKEAHIHPDYNSVTDDNDICVLNLNETVIYSDKIQPAMLPMPNEQLKVGLKGTVSGWGSENAGANIGSLHLKTTEVPVISTESCKNDYSDAMITANMFCAGYPEGGQDACQGDSGGPFVVNGILYGIISWGIGCGGKNKPGVYVNVSRYIDFINSKIH